MSIKLCYLLLPLKADPSVTFTSSGLNPKIPRTVPMHPLAWAPELAVHSLPALLCAAHKGVKPLSVNSSSRLQCSKNTKPRNSPYTGFLRMSLGGGCFFICGETHKRSTAREENCFEFGGGCACEIVSKLSFYDVCDVSVHIYCSLWFS